MAQPTAPGSCSRAAHVHRLLGGVFEWPQLACSLAFQPERVVLGPDLAPVRQARCPPGRVIAVAADGPLEEALRPGEVGRYGTWWSGCLGLSEPHCAPAGARVGGRLRACPPSEHSGHTQRLRTVADYTVCRWTTFSGEKVSPIGSGCVLRPLEAWPRLERSYARMR